MGRDAAPGTRPHLQREVTPRSIVAFYSFAYRLAHRFDADACSARRLRAAPAGFWAAFFAGGRVAGVPARPPSRERGLARSLHARLALEMRVLVVEDETDLARFSATS